MKTTSNNIIDNKIVKVVFFIIFILMIILYLRFFYLAVSPKIAGRDLSKFAKQRNTAHEVLTANRGTIYDNNNNILAQNIQVYKLIAYLSPKRSENTSKIYHVQDPSLTATKLAPILEMEYEDVLRILEKNAYQVEFGIPGSALTELKKEAIEKLNLPGLDFELKYRRYYPNGAFLPYILGYAKTNEQNIITGEMGLELYYEKYLAGTNGLREYQKDPRGFKIANTKEYRKEPIEGHDIHLTIDTNIQLFLERSIRKQSDEYLPETMFMAVMEAKTGKLLGVASEPSFDPNTKDIKSYMNPLVSSQFEPGSTMKIFTYLNSIVKGNYDGNTTFTSGSKTVGPDKVNDWRPSGWGTLTYDQGFALSSNVGIANIVEKNLSRTELYNFFSSLGFGSKTGFPLPNEEKGKINFKYPLEVMNAGFGQGMTVTPIQMLQAFTAISNNGQVLKPYIIDRIVNPNTDEVLLKNKPTQLNKVANTSQVEKIKELMHSVVNCGNPAVCTGSNYAVADLDIMGKTGTAQVAAANGRGYLKGDANTIKSFVGIFPKDDPKYVLYIVVKRPKRGYGTMLSTAFKEVVNDLVKYANLNNPKVNPTISFKIDSYLNKNINEIKQYLVSKGIKVEIIGNGDIIIKQSVTPGTKLLVGERIILKTNANEYMMPNIKNWPYQDVVSLANLLNCNYRLDGHGYVAIQQPPVGTVINHQSTITASLNSPLD